MDIIYEDNHLLAINKQVSEIVQGDKTGDVPLVEVAKQYIKEKYNKPGEVYMGLPHRLDRPTSGLVLLARTSKALSRLNKMFKESQIHKIYWAVVDKLPPEKSGSLKHYLKKNEKMNKSFASDEFKAGSKEARLSYKHIASSDRFHLLEIELHTGRHHQIRAQLAAIGCHIKGDLKYGFARSNPNAGIHLHSHSMRFLHPIKKEEITLVAPPPKDVLWDFFMGELGNK